MQQINQLNKDVKTLILLATSCVAKSRRNSFSFSRQFMYGIRLRPTTHFLVGWSVLKFEARVSA